MFVFKLIFCVLVSAGCECARRCFDCVSISSCDSAADYAEKVAQDDPGVSNATFQAAVCGFRGSEPKVCCSAFPVTQKNELYRNHGGGGVTKSSLDVSTEHVQSLRHCFDCVSISSCDTAAGYAQKVAEHNPAVSNATFQKAVCGYEESGKPKVCCSDFPENSIGPDLRAGLIPQPPDSALRSCSECVLLTSCLPAIYLIGTIQHNPGSTNALRNAFCGFQGKAPKVCCTDLPDQIELHRNVKLLPNTCGEVDGTKIINGNVAKLYEFPWMALIAYDKGGDAGNSFDCAGSIINSRYILTAAHCVIHYDTGTLARISSVRIGEIDLSTRYDCQGTGINRICESSLQNITVDKIIPHENFSGESSKLNDIALLRLSEPINNTKNARPVCLPVSKELRDASLAHKRAVIAGWGLTVEHSLSSILLKATIQIWPRKDCQSTCKSVDSENFKKLCAGGSNKDSCSGDSGGPLIVDSNYHGTRSYVQYGIISYGHKPCATIGKPGVYTDLSKYMQWILDNIRE